MGEIISREREVGGEGGVADPGTSSAEVKSRMEVESGVQQEESDRRDEEGEELELEEILGMN